VAGVVEDAVPLADAKTSSRRFRSRTTTTRAIGTDAPADIHPTPRIASRVISPKLIVEDLRSGAGVEPGRRQESDRLLAGELAEDVRLPPRRALAVDLPHLPQE
jgi:hypothetical protein